MSEADTLVQMAYAMEPLREPVLRRAIEALELSPGSRGLDAGCGTGLPALLLAEAVGPAGYVTGVDLSVELLMVARDIVQKAGLSRRIPFRQGDANDLPFEDDAFDWAWSVACVGYAPIEPLPLVKELARVMRPGASVAILAWSSEKLLPGYPLLEARLDATSAGIAPVVKGGKPEPHFLRALGWFRDAGLEEPTARTYVGDAHAPLTDDLRSALVAGFQMRRPGAASELSPPDRAALQRLCLPESPDFVVDRADYDALFTYSMFRGKVAS